MGFDIQSVCMLFFLDLSSLSAEMFYWNSVTNLLIRAKRSDLNAQANHMRHVCKWKTIGAEINVSASVIFRHLNTLRNYTILRHLIQTLNIKARVAFFPHI